MSRPFESPDVGASLPEPDRAASVGFTVVDRGWDPSEVLGFIGDLEDRLRALLELRAGVGASDPDDVLAGAEETAQDVRTRAASEAARLRARAGDEAQAIRVAAKRDAADIVGSGRLLASEIVAEARDQEEALYARVAQLRTVVRRTEDLLESVAQSGPATAIVGQPGHGDLQVGLEGPPVLQSGAKGSQARRDVPPQVRRLLDELQAPRASGTN